MEKQQQTQVPENLTPQQALAILVQGVQFAQTKGIYSLTDAELISKAVRVFTNQPEGEKLETADAAPAETGAEVPVETYAATMSSVTDDAVTSEPQA